MQRLTWRGVAIHAGHLPGYPASKGCIRLPMEFSRLLFSITGLGTSVIIADKTNVHSTVVEPGLFLPREAADAAKKASAKVAQTRDKITTENNVASILVSGADRKAYLLMDGAISFQTPISILDEAKPLGNHLYSLVGPSPDGHFLKWNAFDIGEDPRASTTVDLWSDPVLGRIDYLDGAGVRQIARVHPGTTMVITDLAASSETRTDPNFTVITEDRAIKGKRMKT